MDDDDFLPKGVLDEDLIPLPSPESSQEAHSPIPAVNTELYNVLHGITEQPQYATQMQATQAPPFGYVDLKSTMFSQPIMPQNFYQPQMEGFPYMMPSMQDYSALFAPNPQVTLPAANNSSPKHETYDSDDSTEGKNDNEPPRKRRKRKNEEIDEDNDRLSELCNKPNAQLTEEEKQEKRKLRNRQTAQRSRNNQKSKLDTLEKENSDLQKKNTKLTQQLNEAKQQIDRLSRENAALQQRLRNNVIIDVGTQPIPPHRPPIGGAKATIVLAIVFCVGCTFFLGSVYNNQGLRYHSAPAADTPAMKSSLIHNTGTAHTTPEHRTGRTLLAKNDTGYCEVGNNLCYEKQDTPEATSVDDAVMELPSQWSADFEGSGMIKRDVMFPSKMKKHFGLDTDDKVIATAADVAKPEKPFNVNHNNKQLISLTEDTFYEKMREKRHKYSMGSIYEFPSPVEETSEDGKKTVHLFCPFIYPILPSDGEHDDNLFGGFGGAFDEDTRIKIHVPIQLLNKTANSKVMRVAEITGENMSLSESYFELDAALAPVATADGTTKSQEKNL
jgi:hypothetical protein